MAVEALLESEDFDDLYFYEQEEEIEEILDDGNVIEEEDAILVHPVDLAAEKRLNSQGDCS